MSECAQKPNSRLLSCYFDFCSREFLRPGNLKRHLEKCHKYRVGAGLKERGRDSTPACIEVPSFNFQPGGLPTHTLPVHPIQEPSFDWACPPITTTIAEYHPAPNNSPQNSPRAISDGSAPPQFYPPAASVDLIPAPKKRRHTFIDDEQNLPVKFFKSDTASLDREQRRCYSSPPLLQSIPSSVLPGHHPGRDLDQQPQRSRHIATEVPSYYGDGGHSLIQGHVPPTGTCLPPLTASSSSEFSRKGYDDNQASLELLQKWGADITGCVGRNREVLLSLMITPISTKEHM